jgi:ATP/maltotriose-dependent transcriptional regulator MalT
MSLSRRKNRSGARSPWHTIASYVRQIYRKLGVGSRAEAALEAQRLGLFGGR